MSPDTRRPGSARSAAAVNDAIRAIVRGAIGRQWTHAERALYGLLLDEWAAAIPGDTAAAV
jgi:hypothetical protein